MRKIGGVSPPHNKNTEMSKLRILPVPSEVHIPMKMHSGKPAIPIVKAGEDVKLGQLIGEVGGPVSSPVHASISGCVMSINERDLVTGQKAMSITIASDGLQRVYTDLVTPRVTNRDEFFDAVRDSGAVGLGGAGYPAAPKLSMVNLDELDYILINGAECEPYVTADTHTMVSYAKSVYDGVMLLLEYMRPKEKIIICIEDNKKEAIRVMQETFADEPDVEVSVLPTLYPQGERKVLVYNITGRIVPEGARLSKVGVVVTNITTITVFARYIENGLPLLYKTVTVDGPLVKNPSNVLAPIGTPIRALFNFCGGFVGGEPKKIIVGGPMMGVAQASMDVPVVKTTNCVLAYPESALVAHKETACIRCGRCLSVCPMSLMPPNIESAYLLSNLDGLQHYKVNMCVECGSCAYVCPAKRQLVQVMQLSKERLWLQRLEQKELEQQREAKAAAKVMSAAEKKAAATEKAAADAERTAAVKAMFAEKAAVAAEKAAAEAAEAAEEAKRTAVEAAAAALEAKEAEDAEKSTAEKIEAEKAAAKKIVTKKSALEKDVAAEMVAAQKAVAQERALANAVANRTRKNQDKSGKEAKK